MRRDCDVVAASNPASGRGFKALPHLFDDQAHPNGDPVAKFGAEYIPLMSWAQRLKPCYRYLAREM